MGPRKLIVAAIAVIAVATGAWLSYRMAAPPPEPRVATLLPGTVTLPEFQLLDHTGARVGPDVFEGQWDLVFFGFTHCPDICPATLQQLAIARRQLLEDGGGFPDIVLVSVDPERDTVDKGVWESNANLLTDNRGPFDPQMGTYQLRGLLCRVAKADPSEQFGPPELEAATA